MIYIATVISLITISYSILIIYFINGLRKNKDLYIDINKTNDTIPSITLLIVCRNEEYNLPKLLNSIENQIIKPTNFIFVNDHSSDNTKNILSNFAKKNNNTIVYNSIGNGKKQGIKEALQFVNTEYIMFTDADCILSKSHCKIATEHITKNRCDMIIGGVKLIGENSLFINMQKIEYSSLQSTTAGTALNNSPIMCNGANLVINTKEYIKHINNINFKEASGDDMFILHSMKKSNKQIDYIIDKEYIVYTQAANNINNFFKQRLRWASKSYSYKDLFTIISTVIIATFNLIIPILIIMSIYSYIYSYLLCTVLIVKFIVDSSLIINYENTIDKINFTTKKIIAFLLTTILYPFYSCIIAISSIYYRLSNKHKLLQWR